MRKCAGSPWKTNLAHVSGPAPRKASPAFFTREMVVRFCLDAMSPSPMTVEEVETWYMLIADTQLRRSWQPDAAEIGDLQARDVVQVLEIVTGQRHFPTDVGALDLRAMARCDRGWFQCRNKQGASAVRPADPPQQ